MYYIKGMKKETEMDQDIAFSHYLSKAKPKLCVALSLREKFLDDH